VAELHNYRPLTPLMGAFVRQDPDCNKLRNIAIKRPITTTCVNVKTVCRACAEPWCLTLGLKRIGLQQGLQGTDYVGLDVPIG
jgi:hypothetical protein